MPVFSALRTKAEKNQENPLKQPEENACGQKNMKQSEDKQSASRISIGEAEIKTENAKQRTEAKNKLADIRMQTQIMKKSKWLKILIYSALTILITITALNAYASHWLAKGGKDKIFAMLSSRAGMEIKAGSIGTGLGRLIARHVEISAENRNFAEINELSIRPDYAAMLRGRLAIGTINADGANINLRRLKDGSLDLPWKTAEDAKAKKTAAKAAENAGKTGKTEISETAISSDASIPKQNDSQKPQLLFKKLRISGLSGIYYDEKTGIRLSLSNGKLRIKDFSAEKPFMLFFSAETQGKFGKKEIPPAGISLKARLSGMNKGAEGSAKIMSGKTRIAADFTIPPAENWTEMIPSAELEAENLELLLPKETIKRYGLHGTQIKLSAAYHHGKKISIGSLSVSSGETKAKASGDFLLKKEKELYPLMLNFLEINGLKAGMIIKKDGSSNMQELADFIKWYLSTPSVIDFRLKKCSIRNTALEYKDEATETAYSISGLSLNIKDYASSGAFSLEMNAKAGIEMQEYSQKDLDIKIKAKTNLKSFEMTKAETEAEISITKENIPFMLKGKIKDFTAPAGRIQFKTEKGSSALPKFISRIWDSSIYQAEADISFDVKKKSLTVNQSKAEGFGSTLKMQGSYGWGKKNSYSINAQGKLNLANIAQGIEMLNGMKLAGIAEIDTEINPEKADANINISGGQYYHCEAGLFSGINTTVSLRSLKEISISEFTAKLNGRPFTFGAALHQKDGKADISAVLKADEIILEADKEAKAEKKSSAQQKETKAEKQESFLSQMLLDKWAESIKHADIKGEIAVKHFDCPLFETYEMLLKTNMAGLDRSLKNINGHLLLSATKGGIKTEKDIMPAMKTSHTVILRSLTAIDRIMGIWQITYNIKNMVSSKKERAARKAERLAQAKYPYPMDRFLADMTVNSGMAKINDFFLTADMLSFKASGKIYLPERQFNLKVRAAADKAPPDGVLPISVSITGPLEDIDASVGKIRTIGSAVTQPFLNRGPVSFIKKTLGLTKKKNNKARDYFRDDYAAKSDGKASDKQADDEE